MVKQIGYGIVVWAVPYVTAVALMDLMVRDHAAFTTVMIVEGGLVGAVLACEYFRSVQAGFLREGIRLGMVWIGVNWALDFAALMPFADLTVWRYFVEIGFRYVAILATTTALGYLLGERLERSMASPRAERKAA
jgi:predicted membrane protein